jgi:opacity protein-like surface antigen
MRLKAILTAISVAGAVVFSVGTPASYAQVAPAAKITGLPITVGVGISDYYLDYGPGRRMQGPVAWASVNIFHGLGIDVSARSIFINTPLDLSRMQQSTFLGGVYYEGPRIWIMRPFVRAAAGIGVIEFPSDNPKYTRDSYSVGAPSAGLDFKVSNHVSLRAQYEYQFWKDFQGAQYLEPQGVTLGVSYALRGLHARPHTLN